MKILVVEDNRHLGDMVAAYLREKGFVVDAVGFGRDAIAAAANTAYDAMILDLGLPDMDGIDVLDSLGRRQGVPLPTLVLTARDSVAQRIAGLNAGADDYILKPFELAELEARLRAVLRRPGQRQGEGYNFGDLSFHSGTRTARIAGRVVDLTRRETALFEELVKSGDAVVVRDRIADRLYGLDEDVSSNAMEATVSRLRRKLASLRSTVGIETLRGIGYRLRSA